MFYVYIVQCTDNTYYTGMAKDVETRINQHNTGKGAKYTKGRSPVLLKYKETYNTVGEALKREHEIKKLSRKQKQMLIQSENQ